jgi:O-antigen/teichoic acid export membrane protein
MTKTAAIFRELSALRHLRFGELSVRLSGATLQVLATWAVVRALAPEDAGVYFRGFVIALGLGTLLRGKYEIHMARHIIGRRAASTGISNGALLTQFARRMLLRSSLLCAVLLVVTADLDIQAPQLQTVLQTYLPFVLALPFVSLASLLGEALRAANRTLGLVIATYAVNLSILLAVALAPANASLALYSWAFFLGSLVAAAVAVGLAWRVFPATLEESSRPTSREELRAVDSLELVGLARGAQLWGPLCILSIWATPLQMAQYAVAARTAMIADFFLPALNLTGGELMSAELLPASQSGLVRQLVAALFYSCTLVVPLLVFAPATLRLYGDPYDSNLTIYALLLAVQWVNGAGRPAVRFAAVVWDARRIGLVIGSGAMAGVLICSLGVAIYGAIAAAAGSLIGALILNGGAILMACRGRPGKSGPHAPSFDPL